MRLIVQRVTKASVKINGTTVGKIDNGLVVLVGITHTDSLKDVLWCANKVVNLRIFSDAQGNMNDSVLSVENAGMLIVSNFTLYGNTLKGLRPSFMESAQPSVAEPLYNKFVNEVKKTVSLNIQTGEFGAMMEVSLVNDGPVTLIIDSPAPISS